MQRQNPPATPAPDARTSRPMTLEKERAAFDRAVAEVGGRSLDGAPPPPTPDYQWVGSVLIIMLLLGLAAVVVFASLVVYRRVGTQGIVSIIALVLFFLSLLQAPWLVRVPETREQKPDRLILPYQSGIPLRDQFIKGELKVTPAYSYTSLDPIWDAPTNGSLQFGVLFAEWCGIGVAWVTGFLLFRRRLPWLP